ncbi:hypothetical protein Trydic_g652 [Trypoxylus dichotomus]
MMGDRGEKGDKYEVGEGINGDDEVEDDGGIEGGEEDESKRKQMTQSGRTRRQEDQGIQRGVEHQGNEESEGSEGGKVGEEGEAGEGDKVDEEGEGNQGGEGDDAGGGNKAKRREEER